MESDKPTIEELITTVLIDIQQKGYSAVQPFSIGEVEQRMMVFAKTNGITLASDQLYVSAKQLQHCMRASKEAKGLVVSAEEHIKLVNFITATRVKDPMEFTLPKYIKVENDRRS